jgi:hypothetical protein
MLDDFVPLIETMQSEGAIVILKWDGGRRNKRYTVVVTRPDTNYVFHEASDSIVTSLESAVSDYRAKHPRT